MSSVFDFYLPKDVFRHEPKWFGFPGISKSTVGVHDSSTYISWRCMWHQELPVSTGRREKRLNCYLTDSTLGSYPLQVAPGSLVEWEIGCTASQLGPRWGSHSSSATGERGHVGLLNEGHLNQWCSLFPLPRFIPSLTSLCFLLCRMNTWGLGTLLNHLSLSHPCFSFVLGSFSLCWAVWLPLLDSTLLKSWYYVFPSLYHQLIVETLR